MSWIEGFFGLAYDWLGVRNGRTGQLANRIQFEEIYPSLRLLVHVASGDSGVLVQSTSVGEGSVSEDTVLLPESWSIGGNLALHREGMLHKALVAGSILKLGLRYSSSLPRDEIHRNQQRLAAQIQIDAYLSKIFPHFQEWSFHLREEIQSMAIDGGRPVELSLGCELMSPEEAKRTGSSKKPRTEKNEESSDSETKKTEIHRAGTFRAEEVDLESVKNQNNPVSHSFEKLETADDYSGGYRSVDGTDELASHERALQELRMDRVVRSEGGTGSWYSAERVRGAGFFEDTSLDENPGSMDFVEYPEWDYRKSDFRPRHCRVFLRKQPIQEGGEIRGHEWRSELQERYRTQIVAWRSKIWSLLHQSSMRRAVVDGPEINLDECVRFLSEMHQQSSEPKLFWAQQLRQRDVASVVLLDQSLSTDSWVANRRVLDVEMEALALIGVLTNELKEPFEVAGVWSETRSHCHYEILKDFESSWDDFFSRSQDVKPTGYTRLGPAIRHATVRLLSQSAQKKLLILLTDGKPTDFDHYEGRYGVEDVHHAILEAQQKEITVRALTVEQSARYYFPALFGHRNYDILSDPSALPEKLFRIYLERVLGG